MRKWIGTALVIGLAMTAGIALAQDSKPATTKGAGIYGLKVKSIDGKAVELSKYKGKVLLIVNVASRCGFTPQYAGLQKLHEKYGAKGLAILGFPANDFGRQEPGSDKEIAAFCSSKFGVSFDMFSKVVVTGSKKCELYKLLTGSKKFGGEVKWNFEKFLVGADGKLIGRYRSAKRPQALSEAVGAALAKRG